MTARIFIALLSFSFLTPNKPLAQAQDNKSAKDFVRQVYADYANPDWRHLEQRHASFYTPDLYHRILADRSSHPGDIGELDFDPICDCQDPGDPGELKVQSITFSTFGQAKLKAHVAFLIANDPRAVTLLLLDTRSGWRIDDITSRDMPSLRALLGKREFLDLNILPNLILTISTWPSGLQ